MGHISLYRVDENKRGFEASEGGDLCFGGNFGDFGGFDHFL